MHLVPERVVPQQERDKAALDCFKIRAALLRAGQENNTFLVASAIRYLAFLIPAVAASNVRRMVDGLVEAFQSRKIPVV